MMQWLMTKNTRIFDDLLLQTAWSLEYDAMIDDRINRRIDYLELQNSVVVRDMIQ